MLLDAAAAAAATAVVVAEVFQTDLETDCHVAAIRSEFYCVGHEVADDLFHSKSVHEQN